MPFLALLGVVGMSLGIQAALDSPLLEPHHSVEFMGTDRPIPAFERSDQAVHLLLAR